MYFYVYYILVLQIYCGHIIYIMPLNKIDYFRIVIILFVLPLVSITGQTKEIDYFHMEVISRENGLSHSEVVEISTSSSGHMLFGTYDGINSYNTYECRELINDTTIKNKLVYAIFEDHKKNTWIGICGAGVYRKNYLSGIYKRYTFPKEFQVKDIYDIKEDPNNNILFGTSAGLWVYDQSADSIVPYVNHDLRQYAIHTINTETDNEIWLGTKDFGLLKVTSDTIIRYLDDIPVPTIYDILVNADAIWVASFGSGLYRIDKETLEAAHFPVLNTQAKSLANLINDILMYDNEKILVATYAGIFVFHKTSKKFHKIVPNSSFHEYPQNVPVLSLYKDNKDILWAGTKGYGVYKYYLNNHIFDAHLLHEAVNGSPLNAIHSLVPISNNDFLVGSEDGLIITNSDFKVKNVIKTDNQNKGDIITKIIEFSADTFLISVWGKGLWYYVPGTGVYKEIALRKLEQKMIYDIKASDSAIWLGMHEEGLVKLNRQFEVIDHQLFNSEKNKGITVRKIHLDHMGNLWAGTQSEGIKVFNLPHLDVDDNLQAVIDESLLLEMDILDIFQDSNKNIWIGTNGAGLMVYNYQNKSLQSLHNVRDIFHDVVYSVTEDDKKDLWIQTNKGITRFTYATENKKINRVQHYESEDGLPNKEFFFCTSYHHDDGIIYFPSKEGIISVNPNSVPEIEEPSRIILTDIEINNKNLLHIPKNKTLTNEGFDGDLLNLKELNLKYKQNRIKATFAALNYYKPKGNKYMIRLDGFEKDWNYLTNTNSFTYINLPPGNYQLQIKASNDNNIWSTEGILLNINISPPWYNTPYAKAGYITIFILTILLVRYFSLLKARIIHDRKLEKVKIENERKLALFKLDFFTKITHEIRTPITLIRGPLEKLMKNNTNAQTHEKYLNLIKSNSDKLYQLTNQILDLRKIDEKKMEVTKVRDDIITFLMEILERFQPFADTKNIDLRFKSKIKSLTWSFDSKIIDRILTNLLSNAIKFTPENGTVTVSSVVKTTNSTNFLHVFISDTGPGMQPDEIKQIFNPFYQSQVNTENALPGTGLGLTLVKELTKLHKGEIQVSSDKNGTTFELVLSDDQPLIFHTTLETNMRSAGNQIQRLPGTTDKKPGTNKRILIVEDNPELNEFLVTLLSDKYRTYSAYNGKEGIKMANRYIPDLIISDVMMPEMNGIDFCKAIKANALTCHISFLILTVKSNESSMISGLQSGADDYILKPFNSDLLLMKIENILTYRENLRQRFAQSFLVTETEKEDIPENDPFIEKLTHFIEENIADEDLSPNKIIKHLNVSRSQFYYKVKNATGMTVQEIIQNTRLKKAYRELLSGQSNISETAYNVGFKNLSHFSKCFRDKFGCNPSNLAKNI